MADFFTRTQAYQGTFVAGTVETEPVFQICATANINASNQFEATFWINENGERIDSDLGDASYRVRDKAGALVSGMSEVNILPDVNGYYQITPVSAALIYDLSHYVLEIEIPVDGIERASSIGLVNGE
jgi:hypothetical protein